MADGKHQGSEEWEREFTRKHEEKQQEIQKRLNPAKKEGCYDAQTNSEGKFFCPLCNAVEGGTYRIITHKFDCDNKNYARYCQQPEISGGRKRRRNKTNKKSRQSKKLKKLKSRKSRRIR